MKKKSTKRPVALGIVVGVVVAGAGIYAGTVFWSRNSAEPVAEPVTAPVPPQPEAPRLFATLEGTPPGSDTPCDGEPVAWTRWSDVDGEHLVIVSRSVSLARPDYDDLASGGSTVAIAARHYLYSSGGPEVIAERLESTSPGAPGSTGAVYKDGVWAGDADGDGRGEALFAYYIDDRTEPGPKRLVLVAFTGDRQLTMSGETRYDPADSSRIAFSTRLGDGMAAAPEALRASALRLWDESQFDLAEPPAYPGFFAYHRFDGAVFQGDAPFWTLTMLPQYMLLSVNRGEKPSVIRYENIRPGDAGLLVEGKGEVEAWSHGFRVTVTEAETAAPDGTKHPFSAIVDWSDGTRLSGWGDLAE